MAFQIVDDVLDFVGDQDQLGKPAGSDLRAGLVTLPTLSYLEQNEGRDLIGNILDNGRKDETSIGEAVHAIRESGAIEASMDQARQFIQRSLRGVYGRYRELYRGKIPPEAEGILTPEMRSIAEGITR